MLQKIGRVERKPLTRAVLSSRSQHSLVLSWRVASEGVQQLRHGL